MKAYFGNHLALRLCRTISAVVATGVMSSRLQQAELELIFMQCKLSATNRDIAEVATPINCLLFFFFETLSFLQKATFFSTQNDVQGIDYP